MLMEENRVLTAKLAALHIELEELRGLVRLDPLTGLANRRAFDGELDRALHLALRHGRRLSLLLIDVDRLKQINDRFGHAAGDEGLRRVGGSIASAVRASDVAARIGGDEFAAILPDTCLGGALRVASRISDRVATHELFGVHRLGVSIGVATFDPDGEGPHDRASLIEAADAALYRAKRARPPERRADATENHRELQGEIAP